MTSYLGQVAEAVQNAIHEYNGVETQGSVDLDAAIASVKKPDPTAWRYRPKDGLKHPAYTEHKAQALAYDPSPTALYEFPPDAQAEIDKYKAEAIEREAFIEELVAQWNVERASATVNSRKNIEKELK